MAKTLTQEKVAPVQEDTKKQRKKQAKKEAKLMLKLEEAKKAVQKAEAKLAKAQTQLHDSNSHLHTLEDKLTHLRSGQQEQDAQQPQSTHNGTYASNADNEIVAVPAAQNQTSATPLAEERTDITDQPTTHEDATQDSIPEVPHLSAKEHQDNEPEVNATPRHDEGSLS